VALDQFQQREWINAGVQQASINAAIPIVNGNGYFPFEDGRKAVSIRTIAAIVCGSGNIPSRGSRASASRTSSDAFISKTLKYEWVAGLAVFSHCFAIHLRFNRRVFHRRCFRVRPSRLPGAA
jgi:hypothetical protein